jgi:hypothetical protein
VPPTPYDPRPRTAPPDGPQGPQGRGSAGGGDGEAVRRAPVAVQAVDVVDPAPVEHCRRDNHSKPNQDTTSV